MQVEERAAEPPLYFPKQVLMLVKVSVLQDWMGTEGEEGSPLYLASTHEFVRFSGLKSY